jgi:hypothetical protein
MLLEHTNTRDEEKEINFCLAMPKEMECLLCFWTVRARAHQGNWQPQFPRIIISLSWTHVTEWRSANWGNCVAVSSICAAQFSNMCSTQADNNSRKLRLPVSLVCPRPNCPIVSNNSWINVGLCTSLQFHCTLLHWYLCVLPLPIPNQLHATQCAFFLHARTLYAAHKFTNRPNCLVFKPWLHTCKGTRSLTSLEASRIGGRGFIDKREKCKCYVWNASNSA